MPSWINGNLQGRLSPGQGEPGKSLEYMWRGTELGIRQEGEEEYQFVDLAPKLGAVAGREIELQVGSGYIQWRYKGEDTWNNLIAITELQVPGPPGIPGRDGVNGKDGKNGLDGTNGQDGKDGVTPNITIGTVATLEAGQQATVTKRGTKEEPVFDFGIPKGRDSITTLTRLTIDNNTLNLTTDKWQQVNMTNNTTINLPQVNDFTEIHLFFTTTEALTLIFPSIKWQTGINIEANKTYEFIFTYINNSWLGGMIQYE